jgi:hypothetical protein
MCIKLSHRICDVIGIQEVKHRRGAAVSREPGTLGRLTQVRDYGRSTSHGFDGAGSQAAHRKLIEADVRSRIEVQQISTRHLSQPNHMGADPELLYESLRLFAVSPPLHKDQFFLVPFAPALLEKPRKRLENDIVPLVIYLSLEILTPNMPRAGETQPIGVKLSTQFIDVMRLIVNIEAEKFGL